MTYSYACAVERIARLDEVQHRVLAAGADMTEVFIAFTHDSFPNQELRGVNVRQFICGCAVLRYPSGVDVSGVAILQNLANQRLDGVCIDCLVERGRIIVLKGFVLCREGVAIVDGSPRLNTALIRSDGEGGEHIIVFHIPAVYELEVITVPIVTVVLGIAGEGNHIDFRAFPSSLSQCSETNEHGKAHEQGYDQHCAFTLNSKCHILSFSAHPGNKKSAL